jgi:alkylhydroperoxidase family enzyme
MARVHIPDDAAFPAAYVFSHYAQKLGAAGSAFSVSVYEHTLLSAREMEGARYRIAQINGCTLCAEHRAGKYDTHLPGSSVPMARPMHTRGEIPDEAFYEAVNDWRTSPTFSARERLAIEFAERMGERPRSFENDEAFWARLHANFTDEQIVDLTLSVASWVAMGRVTHILELDSACTLPKAAAA